MAKRKLNIKIGNDGSIKIDAEGFKGKSCEEVIRKFASLGQTTKAVRKKEYYDGDTVTVKAEVR